MICYNTSKRKIDGSKTQWNSITITIPSEFDIPSGVKYEAKLLPSVVRLSLLLKNWGAAGFYVSDDAFDLNLDKIFDEYDDVFKALKWQLSGQKS